MFELGEQEVGHATDRGAGATRLIEHRLKCDRVDLLAVEQSLELPAEDRKGLVGLRRTDFPPLSLPNISLNVVAYELGHVLGLCTTAIQPL